LLRAPEGAARVERELERLLQGSESGEANGGNGSRAPGPAPGKLLFDFDLGPAVARPSRTTAADAHRFHAALADRQLAG
jgi:hypothetical protein